MKLKLSTLAIIVAIIFFGYYYFIDQAKEKPVAPPASPAPQPQLEPEAQAEGTTQLEIENFYVEPKSHTYPAQTYNPAGNTRPDNVMTFEDQVTYL